MVSLIIRLVTKLWSMQMLESKQHRETGIQYRTNKRTTFLSTGFIYNIKQSYLLQKFRVDFFFFPKKKSNINSSLQAALPLTNARVRALAIPLSVPHRLTPQERTEREVPEPGVAPRRRGRGRGRGRGEAGSSSRGAPPQVRT